MGSNRLKLYDGLIYTYLEKNDKLRFRRIAFKNKMTVSEFNRYIIKLIIRLDESNSLKSKLDKTDRNILDLLHKIGRDV